MQPRRAGEVETYLWCLSLPAVPLLIRTFTEYFFSSLLILPPPPFHPPLTALKKHLSFPKNDLLLEIVFDGNIFVFCFVGGKGFN